METCWLSFSKNFAAPLATLPFRDANYRGQSVLGYSCSSSSTSYHSWARFQVKERSFYHRSKKHVRTYNPPTSKQQYSVSDLLQHFVVKSSIFFQKRPEVIHYRAVFHMVWEKKIISLFKINWSILTSSPRKPDITIKHSHPHYSLNLNTLIHKSSDFTRLYLKANRISNFRNFFELDE